MFYALDPTQRFAFDFFEKKIKTVKFHAIGDTMNRKKSKYRNCVINKKRYYFYQITWLDIMGDSGHATVDEFDNMKPAEMTTNAYIYFKDNKVLKTFASYDNDNEVFSDRNVYPIGCIKKLEKILI
jgi:hypothetical protein